MMSKMRLETCSRPRLCTSTTRMESYINIGTATDLRKEEHATAMTAIGWNVTITISTMIIPAMTTTTTINTPMTPMITTAMTTKTIRTLVTEQTLARHIHEPFPQRSVLCALVCHFCFCVVPLAFSVRVIRIVNIFFFLLEGGEL